MSDHAWQQLSAAVTCCFKQTFLDWHCGQMIRSTDRELSANDWKVQELNECEVRFWKRFGGGRKVRRILFGAVSKEGLLGKRVQLD